MFQHLSRHQVSYMSHALHALTMAKTLLKCASALVIHAVWPDALEYYATQELEKLVQDHKSFLNDTGSASNSTPCGSPSPPVIDTLDSELDSTIAVVGQST